ncbi:hypothetical protein N1851_017233 [Merluccius polli]|uniref:DUF5641 domain-containing protein n=1 Tax=Merluccius polli TaxID=89951 RepID=A0AA47MQL1_MERPO|nr:hypothetical protein N1851_017233 [Merluccius polli]
MKATVPLPPPGIFVAEDLYAKKRWRRVQYLAEQFWGRWRKEYLANIALRQRWHSPRRNVKPGDVVIVKEEGIPRCEWRLGRVTEVCKGKDGLVNKLITNIVNIMNPKVKSMHHSEHVLTWSTQRGKLGSRESGNYCASLRESNCATPTLTKNQKKDT